MFEALFILTTIDAGTRIGRFVLQESFGKIYKPFAQTTWLPGNLITSALIVAAWGYFIYSGSVATIWPMFGTANQLLAAVALTIGTSFIINRGRARYAWVTVLPLAFITVTTLMAGVENVFNIYYPQLFHEQTILQGSINLVLTLVIMISVIVILCDAIPRWIAVVRSHRVPFR